MKPIKIYSVPWHVAHQFELLKIPNLEWHYQLSHIRHWSEYARPKPSNIHWETHYEAGKYDLAVLHIDQQCVLQDLGKSRLYRHLRSVVNDIPVIVINHGSPVYPEMINWNDCVRLMKKLVGNATMVVNSHQAKRDWGWGHPIIHGLDPAEWFDLPKEPRCITFISSAGIGTKYYGRMLLDEVRAKLWEKYKIKHLWVGQDYYPTGFDDYKDFVGRSLVYFNPTFGSPMPRSRTEAMMSGCCIITTPYHDADTFIVNGQNGYLVDEKAEDIARLIKDCIMDYRKTLAIGQEGKKTAIKLFSKERYQKDWLDLINNVLKQQPKWE